MWRKASINHWWPLKLASSLAREVQMEKKIIGFQPLRGRRSFAQKVCSDIRYKLHSFDFQGCVEDGDCPKKSQYCDNFECLDVRCPSPHLSNVVAADYDAYYPLNRRMTVTCSEGYIYWPGEPRRQY